ncbi:MAG TPA: hypothetical protein VLE02_01445 [Nitrosarchaeum sp.]|nr:hypothetical protein [Nitrosarchaeum sp.]
MILVALEIVVICYMNKKEKLSGFGVTSALAFNNNANTSYCSPPDEAIGYSGGCFGVGKVVF